MTDLDVETRNYLRELDSFGQPPPPQRIISDHDSRVISKDFELKLHHINLNKQRRLRESKPTTSMTDKSKHSESDREISKDEIKQFKEQVLSVCRPKNQWYEQQHQSPTVSSQFVRSTIMPKLFLEPKIPYAPISVATVSGDSGYLVGSKLGASGGASGQAGCRASSLGSDSPSSNTGTSQSSLSTSSTTNSLEKTHRKGGRLNATNTNNCDLLSTLPTVKAQYCNGSTKVGRNSNDYQANSPEYSVNRHVTTQRPSVDTSRQQRSSTLSTLRQKPTNTESVESSSSVQQKKYEEMTKNIEKQLTLNRKPFGICGICAKAVIDECDVTCALGQIYHQKCFVCGICSRTLRGKKFYKTKGKIFCEEDYHYIGMQETAERCASCSHPIIEMILKAAGKSYHPRCFRCHKCRICLDDVPFAIDSDGNVYCIDDYHRTFAPICCACRKVIMPTSGSGETIRVVAINKDYHIECFACEACGMQLTDEPDKRCYPLNDHLLCKNCHIHWARTGGDEQPITDL